MGDVSFVQVILNHINFQRLNGDEGGGTSSVEDRTHFLSRIFGNEVELAEFLTRGLSFSEILTRGLCC